MKVEGVKRRRPAFWEASTGLGRARPSADRSSRPLSSARHGQALGLPSTFGRMVHCLVSHQTVYPIAFSGPGVRGLGIGEPDDSGAFERRHARTPPPSLTS